MAVLSPSHVVSIGVWDTHRGKSVHRQCWVTAGPFDESGDLSGKLLEALASLCQALEVVETRISSERPSRPAWEQLGLFDEAQTFT